MWSGAARDHVKLFEEKFAGKGPDVCIMRLEAHESIQSSRSPRLLGGKLKGRVATFTMSTTTIPRAT